MKNSPHFKVGVWILGAEYPYFILDINKEGGEYYRLFGDGSGGWYREITIKDLLHISNKKYFDLEKALKKAFKMGYLDNLSYIEYLARIKNK